MSWASDREQSDVGALAGAVCPPRSGATVVATATLAAGGLAWAGLVGAVADSTGAFASGTMLLRGTTSSSVTCTSSSTVAPIVANSATCPGDPLPTGALTTAASAATTTLSDPGTTSATATTMAAPSCGVEQLADSESHDTGLAMGGVSYGQPGPLGTTGIAFDGSSGWFESTSSYASPSSFTLLAWFKAAPGTTGTIFSVSNAQFDSGATSSDLNLWVNSTGKLVWGVVTLGALGVQLPSEITSSSAVTNGNWHLAAATFSGLSFNAVRRRHVTGQRAVRHGAREHHGLPVDRVGPRGFDRLVGRPGGGLLRRDSLHGVGLALGRFGSPDRHAGRREHGLGL